MEKKEILNKLNELLEKGSILPQYKKDNNPEYDKWYRKVIRLIEKVDTTFINELQKMKFEPNPMSQAMDDLYNSNGEFNKFNKSIIDIKALVETIIEEVEEWENYTERTIDTKKSGDVTVNVINTTIKKPKTKVFIVHGRDNEAKQEVARFIEKLGFEPIILHEQISRQMTIIEKIEAYVEETDFGIVIYTGCDEGKLKEHDNLSPRARQNVVFEHGYLIGRLGRRNVCSLVKGTIEKPGDIGGIVYTTMDIQGSWKFQLAKELKVAGYTVDMNKL